MPRRISAEDLVKLAGGYRFPHIVDVRRESAFRDSGRRIAGAVWRNHLSTDDWLHEFDDGEPLVVYCAHGHNVSQLAAARLKAAGVEALVLEGGFDAYEAAGGVVVTRDGPGVDVTAGPSVWVTRERPKIDRIACPWLIRRFIDPLATFHFVAAEWVKDVAEELDAIPFDVEDVFYSHRGSGCSFDTLIEEFGLSDPSLLRLARIVRGADTAMPELEPQAAGLLALSLGLSAIEPDDHRQLERGMLFYDALYGWCRHAAAETHNWPAKAA